MRTARRHRGGGGGEGVGRVSSLELLRQVPAHSPTSFTNPKCVSSPQQSREREGYEVKPQKELPAVGEDQVFRGSPGEGGGALSRGATSTISHRWDLRDRRGQTSSLQ